MVGGRFLARPIRVDHVPRSLIDRDSSVKAVSHAPAPVAAGKPLGLVVSVVRFRVRRNNRDY